MNKTYRIGLEYYLAIVAFCWHMIMHNNSNNDSNGLFVLLVFDEQGNRNGIIMRRVNQMSTIYM